MSRAPGIPWVPLPEERDEWPEAARVNYLESTLDRGQLLALVGDLADIPEDEIGQQSLLKNGLAQFIVAPEAVEDG